MSSLSTVVRSLGVALAGFACVSCDPVPTLPASLGTPVTDVSVYLGTSVLEVGDTTRIEAEGFTNGEGFGTEPPRTVSFVAADSTILSLAQATWTLPMVPAVLARGLRTGLTTVTATINGVSARDSLRVIPTIGSIVVTPVMATIHINDTISYQVAVNAVDGSPISGVRVYSNSSVSGIAQLLSTNRYHALKPGTITITATLRRATGVATLTVIP
jgi:hypothetical protein